MVAKIAALLVIEVLGLLYDFADYKFPNLNLDKPH